MACLITSAQVDEAVRQVLVADGFQVSESKANGETGVDLLATRPGKTWHIETIAYKVAPWQRSYDFYASFFRAMSRLKDGATSIAIALPADFGTGLAQRASHYGEGWRRIGDAFPELEIWLVDCATPTITRSSWSSWLQK